MAEVTTQAPPTNPRPAPSPATGGGAAPKSQRPAEPVTSGPNTDHPRQSMPPVTLQAKTPVPSTSPASTAPATVPLNTLLFGADFSEKLKAFDVNPDWKQLPSRLHEKIIGYVSLHPDEIAPISARLRQFRDIEREKERLRKDPEPDAHFAEWLQAQPEDLRQVYAKFYQPIVGGPLVDLHPLTPEQRVDQWLASHRRISHRPLTAELVLGVLRRPPPELVKLSSPALRRHFIDQALLGLDFVELEQFAKGVKGDDFAKGVKDADAWRDIVAAALLQRAVAQQSQSLRKGDRAEKTAARCAANLMVVMEGAGDKLGPLLSQMSKKDAALFARALEGEERLLIRASSFDQLLTALNSAPRTAATSAIVQNLYMQTEPRDLVRAPGLAHAMAVAVAREWHPDDEAKAGIEAARLEALQGRYPKLLFDGIAARKATVFNALRSEPRITAELLAHDGGDPARNRTVTNAMAHVMIATQRMMPFGAYEEDAAWRLGGILAIEAGPQLFSSDKVPAKAMGEALAVIIASKINSATFKPGRNAWLAPEIAEPIARLYAQGYGNDTSQSLPGFSLGNFMVGPAMGIEPTLPEGLEGRDVLKGVDVQAIAAKIAAGTPLTAEDLRDAYDLLTGKSFYDGHEEVAAIVEMINDCADRKPPLVKLLPVTFFGENGPITCPLFRVQSGVNGEGDPVYAFIDNAHRKYDSIQDWVDTNHLPPGKVYYPADGHISRLINGDGDMKLASADTPRTHHRLEDALDTAAMVGCFAAGVVGVAVTGGALALVAAGVGTAGGLWIGIQSGRDIYDRWAHGQSMSPLDMDALADYFGMIGGLGGGVAYFGKAARGARLGRTAGFIIGVADDAAAVAGAAGLVQQGGMLIKNWKDLSWKEVLKVFAFGGLTLAGAARPRPIAETPGPPTTPTTPPSALPTARVVPAAPTSTVGKPIARLHGPVTLPEPVKPVTTPLMKLRKVYSPPKPAGGPPPFTFNGNATSPGTSPNASLPVPPVPAGLPPGAGREPPGGASPVARAPAQTGPSRPAASNRPTVPVDPNAQKMAGNKGGKPPEEPPGPSTPSSGTPKTAEADLAPESGPKPPNGGEPAPSGAKPVGTSAAMQKFKNLQRDVERLQREIDSLRATLARAPTRSLWDRYRKLFAELQKKEAELKTAAQNLTVAAGQARTLREHPGPADPATGPRVDAMTGIERLEKQLSDAESQTVKLGEQAEQAEAKLRRAVERQEAERKQGDVSEATRDRVEKALAECRAAEAAEKTARDKARDLRAQYDSANRAEGPADPATAPRVDAVADIKRLEKQLSDAESRTVELGKRAEKAEAELRRAVEQQKAEQSHGDVSEATRDRADKALAECRAAEAAEKTARDKARNLRAQYDSANRAAPPAAGSSPRTPEGVLDAENLPGGISGKVTRLGEKIASLEQRLKEPNNLSTSDKDSLQHELAAAKQTLQEQYKQYMRLGGEIGSIQWEIGKMEERIPHFDSIMRNQKLSMDERVDASEGLAKLLAEIHGLKERKAELARTLNGPNSEPPDHALPGPVEHAATPVSTESNARPLSELGKIKEQMKEAEAEIRMTDAKLANTLSRAETIQLLQKRDNASNEWERLFDLELEKTSDIARNEYQRFLRENQHRIIPEPELKRYLRDASRIIGYTKDNPNINLPDAINQGISRLDREIIARVRKHHELLDTGASPATIELSARDHHNLMTLKMLLEEERAADPAAPPAVESSPREPGGAPAAENLPGGLSGDVVGISAGKAPRHDPKTDWKLINKTPGSSKATKLPTVASPAKPPTPPRRGPVTTYEANKLQLAAEDAVQAAADSAIKGEGKIPGQVLHDAEVALLRFEAALEALGPEASNDDWFVFARLIRDYAQLPDTIALTILLTNRLKRIGFIKEGDVYKRPGYAAGRNPSGRTRRKKHREDFRRYHKNFRRN
jgi:Domain of unknown function (DUF4781)